MEFITPTQGIISTMTGLAKPIPCYWSPRSPAEYENILRKHGISVWAGCVLPEGFVLMVATQDVDRAREILWQHGANLA